MSRPISELSDVEIAFAFGVVEGEMAARDAVLLIVHEGAGLRSTARRFGLSKDRLDRLRHRYMRALRSRYLSVSPVDAG